MYFSRIFASIALVSSATAQDLEEWIGRQRREAETQLFRNIHPQDTDPGVVVASPSRGNPNYFFHWIRDAGLVYDAVTSLYEAASGARERELFSVLDDWIKFERRLQDVPTPSDQFDSRLGEPKYNVDGSAFTEPWGRPQNDGPAIRALTAIRFARAYLAKGGDTAYVDGLYKAELPARTLIKIDLEYTATHFEATNFDLWEEIKAQNLYTLVIQQRALLEGAAFARERGDPGAGDWYESKAGDIRNMIAQHFRPGQPYPNSSLRRDGGIDWKSSNLDVSVILAALHSRSNVDGLYGVTSDPVQKFAKVYSDVMADTYEINKADTSLPPAIGRYPEDRYDGNGLSLGNPWFLTTLAYAEAYNEMIVTYIEQGVINVSGDNVDFLRSFGNVSAGDRIGESDARFGEILQNLFAGAEGFFSRVRKHANPDFNLPEQYNRDTGFTQGATHLTWSYAAFITATQAREAAKAVLGL